MWLELRPMDIFRGVQAFFDRIYQLGFGAVRELASYVLAGAVFVVPAWLVLRTSSMWARARSDETDEGAAVAEAIWKRFVAGSLADARRLIRILRRSSRRSPSRLADGSGGGRSAAHRPPRSGRPRSEPVPRVNSPRPPRTRASGGLPVVSLSVSSSGAGGARRAGDQRRLVGRRQRLLRRGLADACVPSGRACARST